MTLESYRLFRDCYGFFNNPDMITLMSNNTKVFLFIIMICDTHRNKGILRDQETIEGIEKARRIAVNFNWWRFGRHGNY